MLANIIMWAVKVILGIWILAVAGIITYCVVYMLGYYIMEGINAICKRLKRKEEVPCDPVPR